MAQTKEEAWKAYAAERDSLVEEAYPTYDYPSRERKQKLIKDGLDESMKDFAAACVAEATTPIADLEREAKRYREATVGVMPADIMVRCPIVGERHYYHWAKGELSREEAIAFLAKNAGRA